MIAKQEIGKSFMGALQYNLKKFFHPDPKLRAELLATNFASLDSDIVRKEVKLICALRPNLSKYVYHTSLNFSQEELQTLDNRKLKAITEDYLQAMGFTNNQYFIFRHYDAGHPHIHLLANRICFDGSVVSDSNNYQKSERIVRALEYRYNLKAVEQSNYVAFKPATRLPFKLKNAVTTDDDIMITRKLNNGVARRPIQRGELAMMKRKGKASDKLLLQEILIHLLESKPKSISEFITMGTGAGISFLFNQASTGRVSGVTYFFRDFKAKGQALGNQFKWWELIKSVPYNAERDNSAIAQANSRTKAKFNLREVLMSGATPSISKSKQIFTPGHQKEETIEFLPEVDFNFKNSNEPAVDYAQEYYQSASIEISDDIDDEAILGRNRRRKHHPRTNSR